MTLGAELVIEGLAPADTAVGVVEPVFRASPLTHISPDAIDLGVHDRPEGMPTYEELPRDMQALVTDMLEQAIAAGSYARHSIYGSEKQQDRVTSMIGIKAETSL